MILLLAGTAEARAIAAHLAARGVPAVASLAGAVRAPLAQALPTRIGGFGGAQGFRDYLAKQGVTRVIDATHPFAARITARTAQLCAAQGMPLIRLERPGWIAGAGDRWTWTPDEAGVVAQILPGATVFLATGRQSLSDYAGLTARAYARIIDPPGGPFPLNGDWIVGRPPFALADEVALFRRLGITLLVSKDAGGDENRAKLDAARILGLPVLMIRRPAPPPGLPIVADVQVVLDWALAP